MASGLKKLWSFDFRWLMVAYILLVIVDMVITYAGVTYLGMTEGSKIINYYGLELGVVLVFFLSLMIAYGLWRLKNISLFSRATVLGIWMLCLIELAAVINNLSLML